MACSSDRSSVTLPTASSGVPVYPASGDPPRFDDRDGWSARRR